MYKTLKKESLQDQVFNNLKELIIEGQLKTGDYLLSERELSEKFQISRIPIREALKRMAGLGVLTITQGGKTVINGVGFLPLMEIFDFIQEPNSNSIEDLTEARLIFEVGAAKLAAKRATEKDINHLKAICKKMESNLGNQNNEIEASIAFHLALAKASKNKTITNFMIMIIDLQRKSRELSMCNLEGQDLSQKDHWEILEKIENHDPAGAAKAMRKHLILRGPCKEKLIELIDPEDEDEYTKSYSESF